MPERKQKKLLGDLLVDAGLITGEQLDHALTVQKKSGERLGKVIVDLGLVSELDIIEALENQLSISKVSLKNVIVDQTLLDIIPKALIKRHKILPMKRNGNKLTVAMVDPLNLVAIDDLRITTGCEIIPVLATEKEILYTIRKVLDLTEASEQIKYGVEVVEDFVFDAVEEDEESYLIDEAPVVRMVNSIIQQAVNDNVSDIHIEPFQDIIRIRFRVDGVLQEYSTLNRKILPSLVSRIKIMSSMDIATRRVPQDGRIQIRVSNKQVDLRVSTLPTIFGEKIVIRILDKSNMILNLENLGLSNLNLQSFQHAIAQNNGMILITGPTGSGKTTTLYSALNQISSPERNVITIEDPVEYILDNINQIQVNTKAGMTFAAGLRSILRQDPDVIMVGEIRDTETADIAIRAATTGHIVLSTLHTNDAAGAIARLIDMGIEPFLITSSLIKVVAQRLVRVICPKCKTSYQLPKDSPTSIALRLNNAENMTFFKGEGCNSCNNTGYKGRAGVHEIIDISRTIHQLILAKANAEEIRAKAIEEGMITLTEDALEKAKMGITTLEEVLRVAI